jgi:desulfoferrodoxin (superoxide reductase-like protein)
VFIIIVINASGNMVSDEIKFDKGFEVTHTTKSKHHPKIIIVYVKSHLLSPIEPPFFGKKSTLPFKLLLNCSGK